MLSVPKILVRAHVLAARVACVGGLCVLAACGQKGNLTLPNDPDFKQRATLPDIVRRQFPDMPAPKSPAPADTGTTPAPSSPAPSSSSAPASR